MILGYMIGRTGHCARRVPGTKPHRPCMNHLVYEHVCAFIAS